MKDVKPGRTGAQRFEDSSWADGVANTLIDAIFHGNVKIVAYIGKTGDLNRVDDKITPCQQVAALGRGTHTPALPALGNQSFSKLVRQLQSAGINIYKCEASFIKPLDL